MTTMYITSEAGQLVAEINGEKFYELSDCIYDLGWGFGETHEVNFDFEASGYDVYALIDAIYEEGEQN